MYRNTELPAELWAQPNPYPQKQPSERTMRRADRIDNPDSMARFQAKQARNVTRARQTNAQRDAEAWRAKHNAPIVDRGNVMTVMLDGSITTDRCKKTRTPRKPSVKVTRGYVPPRPVTYADTLKFRETVGNID
jgi:hypothetical protein